MRNILLPVAIILLTAGHLVAQEIKSATPLPAVALAKAGATRALIVGISDYQNIPDLQYAHRDAEAFADFLRSPAGGSLPEDNIKLLLNENATSGQVTMAFYWLMEECKEGDKAIIYFSGHGDIDVKLLNQLGFLLCWNAPPYGYLAGGCIPVDHLQVVVNTLAVHNKTRVLLITDACRAGKLAGSDINGPGMTTANLYQQFANATKILSCQPGEVSIEGKQWGGGHGAFSYHLIDALYGLADRDEDDRVTVREVDRYLEDHVPIETDPQKQNPLVVGDKDTKLAQVFPEALAAVKSRKAGELPSFSPGDMRGIEDQLLAQLDSSIREAYAAFQAAIARKDLMRGAGDARASGTADDYYELLIRDSSIQALHGHIKRTFVAALMDDGQEYINRWMLSEIQGIGGGTVDAIAPDFMERAAEILGKSHYLFNDLKAKEYFFRIAPLFNRTPLSDTSRVNALLRTAYSYNTQLPILYAVDAGYQRMSIKDYQKAEKLYLKAIELAPGWAFEYCYLGYCYADMGDKQKAKACWEKAIELKPDFCLAYSKLLEYYMDEGNNAKAIMLEENARRFKCPSILVTLLNSGDFDKAIELADKIIPSEIELEDFSLFSAYLLSYRKKKSLEVNQIVMDSFIIREQANPKYSEVVYLVIYGEFQRDLGNFAEAKEIFEKVEQLTDGDNQIKHRFWHMVALMYNGQIDYIQGHYPEAERRFRESLEIDSTTAWSSARNYFGLALIAAKKGDQQSADALMNKSLAINSMQEKLFDFVKAALIDSLHDEAVWALEKAATQFPAEAVLPYHRGYIYANLMHRPDLAIPCYRDCLQRNSSFKIAYYSLAKAYLQTGNKKSALDWLEQGLQKGYISKKKLDDDPVWDEVRGKKRFRGLVRAYLTEK